RASYILSTILSENQYEPKFIATAKKKPKMRPCPPPSISPMNMSKALSAPSSSAVFTTLDIWLFYPLNQSRDECRAVRQGIDLDVLVQCVSAVADCTESIKCWDADRRGEVAVGPAAGATFPQIGLLERARDITCTIVKTLDRGAALERRTVETAVRFDGRARIEWREAAE